MKRLTDEQKESLREDLKSGMRNVDIAKKYDVSGPSVRWHQRQMLGLPQPPSRQGKKGGTKSVAKLLKRDGANHRRHPINEPQTQDEALEALNADILAGMPESEVVEKHGIGRASFWKRRQRLREESSAILITDEQRPRLVELVKRIAEKRPRVFDEMVAYAMKKNPNVLLEVF